MPDQSIIEQWLDELPEDQIQQELDDLTRQMDALVLEIQKRREVLELKKRFREYFIPRSQEVQQGRVVSPDPTLDFAVPVAEITPRSIKAAVLRLMDDSPGTEWPVRVIFDALVENGWLDNTNQALRSLAAALSRMRTEGDIERPSRGVYKPTTGSAVQVLEGVDQG